MPLLNLWIRRCVLSSSLIHYPSGARGFQVIKQNYSVTIHEIEAEVCYYNETWNIHSFARTPAALSDKFQAKGKKTNKWLNKKCLVSQTNVDRYRSTLLHAVHLDKSVDRENIWALVYNVYRNIIIRCPSHRSS